jgi:hypothetical protein
MYRCLFVIGCLAVGVMSPVIAQQNPFVGTWKRNLAKSKCDPPPSASAPRSDTRKVEVFEGDGITLTTPDPTGKGSPAGYSAHFDEKEYPFRNNPNYDTIALKRLDANSFESTLRKAGKVVVTGITAVSKDGKTMTLTSSGTNSSCQQDHSVVVWDRQ